MIRVVIIKVVESILRWTDLMGVAHGGIGSIGARMVFFHSLSYDEEPSQP